MSDPLKALLLSRKFWLAFIGVVVAAVLFAKGMITAEQLTNAILVLASVVIAGIAIEDAAEKSSAKIFLPKLPEDEGKE